MQNEPFPKRQLSREDVHATKLLLLTVWQWHLSLSSEFDKKGRLVRVDFCSFSGDICFNPVPQRLLTLWRRKRAVEQEQWIRLKCVYHLRLGIFDFSLFQGFYMSTATSGKWHVFFLWRHKNIVIWMLTCGPRCTTCWEFNQQTFTEQKALCLLCEELGSVFPGQGLLLSSDRGSSDLYGIQIVLSALVEQKEFLERGLGVSHKVCASTLKP